MKDQKIFVTKSTLPPLEEYVDKIKTIWETHWLTNNGALHHELEDRLKEYLGIENITLYTNGHLALENIIQALNLERGSEVITTPFTFVSTTHAITRNGLKPVFCDINPNDFTIDVEKIEELITDKTCAIIPVHIYGNICDVKKIEEIAKRHGLKVIYDAAHAFGVKLNGESVTKFGDASMFSFHATKVFNTIEGGAVIYQNSDLKVLLDRLKNFGIKNEEVIDMVGGNAKMNEFQAAMGLCNIEHLDENIEKRKKIYLKYRELLETVKGIQLNCVQNNVESNYAYFPIVIHDEYGLGRNELYDLLKENDIYSRKYFYPATNETDCYEDIRCNTPISSNISKRILTLPLYPDLEIEDVERICKIIRRKK